MDKESKVSTQVEDTKALATAVHHGDREGGIDREYEKERFYWI